MKIKRTALMTALTLFLVSCQEEDELKTNALTEEEEIETVSFSISQEDALKSLMDFMSSSGNASLKSLSTGEELRIGSVLTVKQKDGTGNKAKATGKTDADGNLIYIVNFEGDNGYAILAADSRIDEPVLAIADKGSLTEDEIQAFQSQLGEKRPIYDAYPLTGDGFYTSPEYPDEEFINPNTVELYDAEEDDILVGDFSTDDIGEESSLSLKAMVVAPKYMEAIGLGLCADYASSRVDSRTEYVVSWGENNEDKHGVPKWEYLESWHQHSPFNDLCPRRKKFIIVGNRRRAPAGCFPLAIAKIMTKLRIPQRYEENGHVIDWNALDQNYGFNNDSKSASYLLYGVGDKCKTRYFYEGSFTAPHHVLSMMEDVGFRNVDSWNYDFDRVKDMLDKGLPVPIYAMHNINVTKSHAWVIDNYKFRDLVRTEMVYKQGKQTSTSTSRTKTPLVHCDFGWGGQGNGYYVSGVFNSNSIVEPNGDNKSFNYNNYIKIITYSK